LTRSGRKIRTSTVRRICMSDVLFLAAGIGGFVVFAFYARALSRL
jgi:hypothetical protein